MPKQPDHWDLAAVTAARMRGQPTVPRFVVMTQSTKVGPKKYLLRAVVVETNGLRRPSKIDLRQRCCVRIVKASSWVEKRYLGSKEDWAKQEAAKLNHEHENGLPLPA